MKPIVKSISKRFSGAFPTQNGLTQRHVLWSLLFNFALGYSISKVQENQEGFELKGAPSLSILTVLIHMART